MSFPILKLDNDNYDLSIINNITKHGFDYFIYNYPKIKDGNEKELNLYQSYLNMYFFEDIWEELLSIRYNNALLKMNEEVIQMLIEFIEVEKQNVFWNHFLGVILLDTGNLYRNYNIILKFQQLLVLIPELVIWKYSKTTPSFLGILIDIGEISDTTKILDIYMRFLKNKDTRHYIISWFVDVYKVNLERKNISNIQTHSNIKNDNWILLLSSIVMETWLAGKTYAKISNILVEYCIDTKSKMQWVDNPIETDNNYNYLTECYFLIHKFLEISVINLIDEMSLCDKDLNYFKLKLADDMNILQTSMVEEKIRLLKIRVHDISDIFSKYNSFMTSCSGFYHDTIYWITNTSSKFSKNTQTITDILLQNYTTFNSYNSKTVIDINSLQFLVYILGPSDLTNNPHIKSHFLKLLIDNVFDNGTMIINSLNLEELHTNLIRLFLFVEESNSDGFNEKYTTHYHICYLLKLLYSYEIDITYYLFNNDIHILKKFIHIFMGNLSHIAESCFSKLKELSQEEDIDISENKGLILNLCDYLSIFSILTDNSKLHPIFMGNEVRYKVGSVINYLLTEMVGKEKNKLKIRDPKKCCFEPLKILGTIKNIVYNLSKNELLMDSLLQDSRYYSPELIPKMVEILGKKLKLNILEEQELRVFCGKIRKQYHINTNLDLVEIPDEFCDPIMSSLIEEPVVLPNTNTIMDKTILSRILIDDEHNPFNREPLNMDMVDTFNSKPEILSILTEFKERVRDWKETLNKLVTE